MDYAASKQVTVCAYYGDSLGRSVVRAIYPRTANAEFGFFEVDYRLSRPLRANESR